MLIGTGEYDAATAPTKQHWPLGIAAVVIAVGVGVAMWASARDGSAAKQPTDDPAVFLRSVVSRMADNGYGAAWEQLHPAQQRVATRTAYGA